MDGVVEVANVYDPNRDADQRNNLGELFTKLIEFLLQGSPLLFSCCHLIADFANFCARTSSDSNPNCSTSCDICTLKAKKRKYFPSKIKNYKIYACMRAAQWHKW